MFKGWVRKNSVSSAPYLRRVVVKGLIKVQSHKQGENFLKENILGLEKFHKYIIPTIW